MIKHSIELALTSFVLLFFLFLLPKTTFAATCTFTYNPNPPNQNMGNLIVTVNSPDLRDGTYYLYLIRPGEDSSGGASAVFAPKTQAQFTSGQTTFTVTRHSSGWIVGTYEIFINQNNLVGPTRLRESPCRDSWSIKDIPTSTSCVASIENKPIDPDTGVVLAVNGINPGTYDIFINGTLKYMNTFASSDRKDLGTFDVGFYTVTIKNTCGIDRCLFSPARLQCNPVTFLVGARGSGEGGQVDVSTGAIPAFCEEKPDDPKCVCIRNPKDAKCAVAKPDPCGLDPKDPGIRTAIGCIHTNPASFAKDLLNFVIGISGGLAFLMMILGAFQMLTSGGNPETLAAGRSRLTSAVIGLLFIIFAILLLQIIGRGILNIPGFS